MMSQTYFPVNKMQIKFEPMQPGQVVSSRLLTVFGAVKTRLVTSLVFPLIGLLKRYIRTLISMPASQLRNIGQC